MPNGISYSAYLLENDPTEQERRRRRAKSRPEQYKEESDALAAQMERQRRELALRGQEPKKDDGGVLGRVFDVISRPNYAVANIFMSTGKNDEGKGSDSIFSSIKEAGKGFAKGLTGEEKNTFSDVIEQEGVTNPWVKGVGGLAADIILDPTTYMSFGGTALAKGGAKVGGKITAKTLAGKAAKETLEKGGGAVGKRVTQKLLDDFVAKGLGDTAEHLSASGAKRLSARFLQDDAYEAALKTQDDFFAKEAPSFGLKMFGKDVPLLQSQKLYSAGEKLSTAFKSTGVGKGLSQTFQTSHLFPGPLKSFKREAEGYSFAQFEDMERAIRGAFRGVAKEDKRLISDAIENGIDLSGQLGKGGTDLGALQREAMDWRDSITQIELSKGLLAPEDVLDNYLYHHYRTTDRVAVKNFKSTRKKVQNPSKQTKSTTIKTLKAAEAEGLKPVREIDDVLLLRAGKSYKEQGRAAFADAVSREFGVSFGKEGSKLAPKLGLDPATSRYLKGAAKKGETIYLPREVNQAIKHMDGLYDSMDETNQLLRMFDKSLAHWKFGATAINPGHHIRNAIGDMFLNTLDGVSNPYRYLQSARVMQGDKVAIKVGKGSLNAEEIKNLYRLKGVKSGYTRVEIGARKFRPTEKIREVAESREDFTRMAHFIDALKKEAGDIDPKNLVALDKAASRAAARVRKFNIDYGDLTDVEKKVFKRVVPFYTWMRKNVPLQLEALALTPGRQAVVPKGLQALRTVLGDDGEYPTIGGSETVPKWLRDMSGIQILGEGEGRNGVYMDPSVLVPSMDALDLIAEPTEQLIRGNPEKAFELGAAEGLNMLNPALRAGVEYGTDTNTFTGGKRDENFLQNQLPITRLLTGLGTGQTDKWDLANYATGASFREIGEPQKLGELRRQQDILEGQLRSSGDVAAKLLASKPLDVRVDDYGNVEEDQDAALRRSNLIADLQSGGQTLALVERLERMKEDRRRSRLDRILNSYTEINNDTFYGI